MDRVRLGRVLGRGARLAATTAMEAVDAATAEIPRGEATPASRTRRQTPAPEVMSPGRTAPRAAVPQASVQANLGRAAAAAGKGVLAPLGKASRALWHELTGSFFALFALSFAAAGWKNHAEMHSPVAEERYRFYGFCGFALLFAYFSVTSFLRARTRR